MKQLILFVFLITCSFNARTQNQLYTAVIGDTIELHVEGTNGAVQWQESEDSLTWNNVNGAINNPQIIITSSSSTGKRFFKANVIDNNICENSILNSSIIRFKIINNLSQIQSGDWYKGGIVFNPSFNGSVLIAPTNDQATNVLWGCLGVSISGAHSLTNGWDNTNSIVESCLERPIASSICDTLNHQGYSDWYLPAIDELISLYQNRQIVGGFIAQGYFSSTEYDSSSVWSQVFGIGSQTTTDYKNQENSQLRCIRASNLINNFYRIICKSTINIPSVYQDEKICLVTIDTSTWKNKIMWEKTANVGTKSFNIYKEFSTNTFSPIGNVPFDSSSYFIDLASNPESYGARYKIAAVDTCGAVSELSPFHKTMNLVISTFGSTMGLSWTAYEDGSGLFVPGMYYIYRGTLASNMTVYDSIPGSFTSYNDNNVFDSFYYMVGVKKEGGCDLSKSSVIESFSNKKLNFSSSITEYEIKGVSIFPNPANDRLNIEINEKVILEILNIHGQLIDSKNLTENSNSIDLTNLISGVYTLRISNDRGILIRKLIKQ